MYIIILNSDTESVDCLDLSNKPFDVDLFEFVENTLDYQLTHCEWSLMDTKPKINFLN
jgi:hypothetical protein